MKTYIQALKWITGIYHLLLIPCYYLFRGLVNLYGIPLLLLIALVAFFPYIDIVLHIIAAIFLLLDAASTNAKEVYDS
ncbi:hypothetical protein PDN41_21700 [Bacillus cereus]|nr:hypothetical protein [Bacillus cereus]